MKKDEDIPRAKRLKLLREAKERKEGGKIEEYVEPMENDTDNETAKFAERGGNAALDAVELREGVEVDVSGANDQTDQDEDEEDIVLASKRGNHDIKRDLAPMLQKLERRTEYAIVEMLRMRTTKLGLTSKLSISCVI